MWAALGAPAPRVIVDVGAGTGLFSAKFAELAPRSTVYAVDTEQAMLDWMRDNRSGVAEGRLVPTLSTETAIPLEDGVADLLIMINVHHEFADPAAVYAEARRLLRSGGQALVVDWAPIDTPKGPPLAVRATAEALEGLLSRAGFADIVTHHGALAWHNLVTAVRL